MAFNFGHNSYLRHAFDTKFAYHVINDSLQALYENHVWYKEDIDQENSIILKAIDLDDASARDSLIRQMFTIRDERRRLAIQRFNRSVDFYEKCFETMEGTARYVEAAVIRNFNHMKIPDKLARLDDNYKPPDRSVHIKAKPEPDYLYKTEVSQSYTYAMGYNVARLLDKLRIEYKSRLFKTPDLTLEDILRNALNKYKEPDRNPAP